MQSTDRADASDARAVIRFSASPTAAGSRLVANVKHASRVHAVSVALAAASGSAAADALRRDAEVVVAACSGTSCFGEFAEWALGRQHAAGSSVVQLSTLPLATLAEIYRRACVSDERPTSLQASARRIVSFDALSRARTTLDDFSRFYFPLHGLDRHDFFRFLPILTYAEACIYQMDEENEAYTRALVQTPLAAAAADAVPGAPAAAPVWSETATGAALHGVLSSLGLLSRRAADELRAGDEYWRFERQLCASMAACAPVSLDDVYACSGLKSFDYRVLHALLCEMAHLEASDELLAFLRIDECLTDMADDLFDYEKDVRKNSFNVLRGCTHAAGEKAPLILATRIGELEKEHEQLLGALPQAQREAFCASRREAMARPGSEKWIFPPVVMPRDEGARRAAWDAAAQEEGESEVESDAEDAAPASARGRRRHASRAASTGAQGGRLSRGKRAPCGEAEGARAKKSS